MRNKATIENALTALMGELVVVEEGDDRFYGRLEKEPYSFQYVVDDKVFFVASTVHEIKPATANRLARIIL